jgi:phosphoglycerate dehydrogenase-like enzyme
MSVHAYTLHPRSTPESRRDDSYHPPGLGDPDGTLPSKWYSGGTLTELHGFLSSGLDLLVVATPLTEKTRHLIGRQELEVLGKTKTFVSNISRGAVIDSEALIDSLNSEAISGAALDVTDPEPLPNGHPLWSAKNLIITPHVSGGSTNYGRRVLAILGVNLERLSQGKDLINRVSRKDGY